MSLLSISFTVQRRIKINKPVAEVFSKVVKFSEMEKWSPWLVMERGAKVEIKGEDGSVGAMNSWEGDIIGAGESEITSLDKNKKITYDLRFTKPWKSQAKYDFQFVEIEEGCEVIWSMNSTLPIFMFWMKKSMEAWIGMDYVRGLYMLKGYAETGKVGSALAIKEPANQNGFNYIGAQTECGVEEVGPMMESDFTRLDTYMKDHDIHTSGTAFSIYHKYDVVKRRCKYTSGLSTKMLRDVQDGFVSGDIPPHKALIVEHIGSYQYLGNAWTAGYTYLRSKKVKLDKSIDPFEIYVNNPMKTPPEELKTVLYFPVK